MASDLWYEWREAMVRQYGHDNMARSTRRWCWGCLWLRWHSVHLETIRGGRRTRYVCMACTHHVVEDTEEWTGRS